MEVAVLSVHGEKLWSYGIRDGCIGGTASADYLRDGTQRQIIDALSEALDQASGQLGGLPLNVVDAVPNVRASTAKINRDVPVSATRHGDPGWQHAVKSAVVSMATAAAVAAEVSVVHDADVALVIAVDNDNVASA